MPRREAASQARAVLDRRLAELPSAVSYAAPRSGWIRGIRDALGMTGADLAARMGITGASVRSLEEKERSGGIRLSSLQRAAQAMDCTLVYAFVPNTSLQETVEQQARKVLAQQQNRARQTMALEAQEAEVVPYAEDARLRSIIDSSTLWSQRGVDE